MSIGATPPYPTGDIHEWARQIVEFLQNRDRSQAENLPEPIFLKHQVQPTIHRATEDGMLMYDPERGLPVYSKGGQWLSLIGSGGGGGGGATYGDTFPASPDLGALHYLTVDPVGLYIWYDDGDSVQWVQTNGGGSGGSTFLSLTDTPDAYTPRDGDFLKVVGDKLEFSVLQETNIDDLNRVRWLNKWTQQYYVKNDMVLDGIWTMVANKGTTERAAPQRDNNPVWDLPEVPTWTEQTYQGVVESGREWTITAPITIVGYEIWVPEVTDDVRYDVKVYAYTQEDQSDLKFQEISTPALVANEWNTIRVSQTLVGPGSTLGLYVAALNTGGNIIVGPFDWVRSSNSNTDNPPTGNWNRRNQEDLIRIHKVDNQGVNRGADGDGSLEGIIVGSTITTVDQGDANANRVWVVNGTPTYDGTVYSFPVNSADIGPSGEPTVGTVCAITIDVPIPAPTKYVEIIGGNPYTNSRGIFSLDGVSQDRDADAFGVRILWDTWSVSEDWDIVTRVGDGVGGSSESASQFIELADTPTDYTGAGGYGLKVNSAETGVEFIDLDSEYLPLIGGELSGALLMTGVSLGIIAFQRGGTGQKWGIGTNPDQTAVTIYDFDAEDVAARFDVRGADVPSSTTVITAEKGDGRYLQLATGGTLNGVLRLESTLPQITLYDTDQPVDEKWVDVRLNNGDIDVQIRTDAGGFIENIARIQRDPSDVSSSFSLITRGAGDTRYLPTPTAFGASEAGSDTANDAVFATMETQLQDREVDLEGKTWPVTHVPNLNARNGYWLVTNFSQSMDVRLAARDTREMTILGIEGGKTTVSWAQDVYAAYNGVMIGGYMPADGHTPGSQDWTVFRITEHGRNIADFEPRQNFGNTNENEVFAATVVPPSTSGGAYDGAFQYAISNRSNGLLTFHYRALAEYEQDNTGGGLDQGQGNWSESYFGGATLGSALRGAVNSAYSVSTSGTPTVVHGLTLYGANTGSGGNVLFGFHGLSGFSRPCIGYIDGTPKDGAGRINFVGNVANLTEGVEPTVCWYKNGGSSRLCGFVRSQGSSYPIRFWSTQGSGLTQAAVEGAATQDCPGGNDFGTYSPIPCRMRPRRKGSVSGWIATWETIDGDTDDELHFTFTDTRTRDGGPGVVWLYHGKVTRGSGHFDDMWDRAEITALYPLYFSNSNSTDTSNQVGVSSMAFIDSNTLVIGASTMRPAISGDEDEAMLLNFVLKFDDDYADTSERRQWDDGTQVPMYVFRAPEFVNYRGDRVALGERVTKVISADAISYTGQGNIVVAPQSGTTDNLDTILNGRDGDIVTLRSNSSSNTITVVDTTGNLSLDASSGNFVLDNARDRITLIYDSGSDEWVELSRSNNAS